MFSKQNKLFLNGIAYHWKCLLLVTIGNGYLVIISIIITEQDAVEQL